ncbi:MAG: TonB-dependent receptor plug domain-containing protein [Sulfuricurvum sp.]
MNRRRTKVRCSLLAAVMISVNTVSAHADMETLIASLDTDMHQAASMAAKTNQNVDYQPFILTVLYSDDLMKFGVRSLGEALNLFPAVDMTTDTTNNRTPIIRGSNPLAYGQTKLSINGIIVNDLTFDSYNTYLDFPIELIERIELVRGSGSFIDGVNGYAGTINVVTRNASENESGNNGTLFASTGSDASYSGGIRHLYKGDGWSLGADLFYQTNDLHTPALVTDSLRQTGNANLGSDNFGAGFIFRSDALTVQGRLNRFQSGSAFGNLNYLPNKDGHRQIDSWYLNGEYRLPLSDTLKVSLKGKVSEDGWESNSRTIPAVGPYALIWPNGYWGFLSLKNRTIKTEGMVQYTGLNGHTLKLGTSVSWEKSYDMSSLTTNKTGGTSTVDYTNTLPFFNADDARRRTNEFYLSDSIDINPQWAVVLTAGGIQTDTIALHSYARGAVVYQPWYNHIFKVMVGSGIRLPSWQEMYVANNPARIGNPSLDPEHVNSYEVQYIYKPTEFLTAAVNAFYLSNTDQIVRDSSNTYQNIGKNTIRGVEAELRGNLSDNDYLLFSYSYMDGEATVPSLASTDEPYAASHLLKGAYSHDFDNAWSIGCAGYYVGEKLRDTLHGDLRPPLEDRLTADVSLNWNLNTKRGFYAQGVIKNIGDVIVYYPSVPNTYANDYPVSERSFWLRGGWRF